ncbi:MAG: cupredoxin domain-containing protein, partial [Hyphomicrobiales bacterium]
MPHRQDQRTVTIDMNQLSFSAKTLTVTAGETVKFVLRNSSYIPHDFTIGTALMQKGRRAVISELSEAGLLETSGKDVAALNAPNAVLIPPGETREVTWTFTRTQDLEFGCNVPGHYEFGMKGSFRVRPSSDPAIMRAKAGAAKGKLAAWLSKPAPRVEPATTPKLASYSAAAKLTPDVDVYADDGVAAETKIARVAPTVPPAKKPRSVRKNKKKTKRAARAKKKVAATVRLIRGARADAG